ncbi:hypothetical protein EBR96_01070 [bacterium]|nr:hypothetical protein [bacterium]
MRWSDDCWLIDLTSYLPYWQSIATTQKKSVYQIWETYLSHHLGSSESNRFNPVPIRAVWDHHPWRAILILLHMKHHQDNSQSYGFITPNGAQYESLWQNVSWDTWNLAFRTLDHHINCQKKEKQKASRLLLTASRLNISKPAQLNRLPQQGIQRRFGAWITEIIHWTVKPESDYRNQPFPWIPWRTKEQATVTRHFEIPLSDWSEWISFLVSDLDQLSSQIADFTIQLQWTVRFENDEEWPLEIRFRQPHHLASEKGHQKSACRQLENALQHQEGLRIASAHQLCRIVGWELSAVETLYIPPELLTLFEMDPDQHTHRALRRLHNQVTVPLHQFQLITNWVPEFSYITRNAGTEPLADAHNQQNWNEANSGNRGKRRKLHQIPFDGRGDASPLQTKRPLFLFTDPLPLNNATPYQLTERTLSPWWNGQSIPAQRRYARLHHPNGGQCWGYWNPAKKNWVVQGMYG